jgi:hypothetical protein
LSAAFADNTPTVRAGALKVVEELLLARSQALSARAIVPLSISAGSSSNTMKSSSSLSVAAAASFGAGASATDDTDLEEGTHTGSGSGLSSSVSSSSGGGGGHGNENLWDFLQPSSSQVNSQSPLIMNTSSLSQSDVTSKEMLPNVTVADTTNESSIRSSSIHSSGSASAVSSPITVQSLLSIYLRSALSDVSPVVRSEAAMCISCLFPKDWLSFLKNAENEGGFESALQQRDAILKQLVTVAFDGSPKVRVAAARAFGAYLAFPEWKTQLFAQLAAKVLLVLMSDDNLQVRAKASWALGNLCAPASNSSSSSSLAASAAASHHFPLQQQNVIQTVFPFGNEPTTRCIWSPSQCASVTAAVVAADDSHLNVLAPLELYNGVGSSQSMLLSLLSLPLLRVVTQATLKAAGDHDKVSCTAVRTLGYCVQALLYHWLPLPTDVRDVVNPVILANLRPGIAPTSVKRAEAGPCPDDDLIKASMLALADIVAGSTSSSSSSSLVSSAISAVSTSSPLNATNQISSSSSSSSLSKAPSSTKWVDVGEEDDLKEILSKRLQGKSLTAFETSQSSQQNNNANGGGGDLPDDEVIGQGSSTGGGKIALGPPIREEKTMSGGGGGKVGSGGGGATSKFRFNKDGKTTPGGGRKGPGMDSGNWRERSSPSTSNATGNTNSASIAHAAAVVSISPPPVGLNQASSTPENKKLSYRSSSSAVSSSAASTSTTTMNSPSTSLALASSPNSEPAMKVRWNACHAVYQIVPLTHRLVSTHPGPAGGSSSASATLAAAAAFKGMDIAGGSSSSSSSMNNQPSHTENEDPEEFNKTDKKDSNTLQVASSNNNTLSSTIGGTGTGGMVDLSQPSPSRPKVRRNEASGQSLMWAGVDHLSTANSPFLPKGVSSHTSVAPATTTPAIAVVRPASPIETDTGGGSGGGGGSGSVTSSLPPSLAPSMTSTPQRFSISSNSPLPSSLPTNTSSSSSATHHLHQHHHHQHHGSSSGGGGGAGGAVVITDPTLPSVRIGTTWVPPVLAALQVALSLCVNFKVRIAAAQALGSVPSRMSYRIPLPPSLSFLPPNEVSSTVTPVALALQATAAVLQTTTSSSSTLSPSSGASLLGLNNSASVNFSSNTTLSTTTTAAQALLGYLSPALQRPGFDAYPPALVGLVHALENSEQTSDFTEYRYKDQLKGVIRLALLKTILLAERIDYGVSKAFFDSKAELLYEWLCAEEALLILLSAGADSAPPPSSSSSSSMVNTQGGINGRRSSHTNHIPSSISSTDDQTIHNSGTSSSSTPFLSINESFIATFNSSSLAPPASPTRPIGMSLDDVPVRASRLPVFGTLQAHPSIEAGYVKDCFRRLASLFGSRVKTVPADLLRRFQEKAGGL